MKAKDLVSEQFRVGFEYLRAARGTDLNKLGEACGGVSARHLQGVLSDKQKAGASPKLRECIAKYYGVSVEGILAIGERISAASTHGTRPSSIHPREQAAYNAMVHKNELAGRKKTPGAKYSTQPTERTLHRVPVISWVQAGDWTDVFDPFQPGYAEEWIETTATTHENAFALVVRGDSMEPEFVDGDVVVVDPGLDVHSGDYVIAKNGDEATFKQLVMDGSGIFLKPMNNRYPIKEITGGEMRIVGVVVAKEKRYR